MPSTGVPVARDHPACDSPWRRASAARRFRPAPRSGAPRLAIHRAAARGYPRFARRAAVHRLVALRWTGGIGAVDETYFPRPSAGRRDSRVWPSDVDQVRLCRNDVRVTCRSGAVWSQNDTQPGELSEQEYLFWTEAVPAKAAAPWEPRRCRGVAWRRGALENLRRPGRRCPVVRRSMRRRTGGDLFVASWKSREPGRTARTSPAKCRGEFPGRAAGGGRFHLGCPPGALPTRGAGRIGARAVVAEVAVLNQQRTVRRQARRAGPTPYRADRGSGKARPA